MSVFLRPVDAERCRPVCSRCGWIGEPQLDRKAAAAAWEHDQTCQTVPDHEDTGAEDGAP